MWILMFLSLLQFIKTAITFTSFYRKYNKKLGIADCLQYFDTLELFLISFLVLNFISKFNLVYYGEGLFCRWKFYEKNRHILFPLFR